MPSLIFFSVFITLCFDGYARSQKNVLFIYDMDTTIYDKDVELLQSVKRAAIQLLNDGLNFNFSIMYPYESYIEEISKSAEKTLQVSAKSYHNYEIKEQSTLKNLHKGLQKSPSHSIIYMITNVANPSDKNLVPEILKIIQIKKTEINFILKSEYLQNHFPEEYRLISFVSNGFVQYNFVLNGIIYNNNLYNRFKVLTFEANEIVTSMYIGLKYALGKTNILSIDNVGNAIHCFYFDPFIITNTMQVQMIEENPEEYEIEYFIPTYPLQPMVFNSLHRGNILSRSYALFAMLHYNRALRQMTKGQICIAIKEKIPHMDPQKKSSYSLRVSTESNFNFNFGFSTDSVSSLNETYLRPIRGKKNQIYVSPNYKICQVESVSFKIVFRNGTSLEWNLLSKKKNHTLLFVGNFELPNEEYFYIKLKALVNGELVIRMSSNAINAQNHNQTPVKSDKSVLETILLIIVLLGSILLFVGTVHLYFSYYKKSPQTLQLELKKHHRTTSNVYYNVVYKAKGEKVVIT